MEIGAVVTVSIFVLGLAYQLGRLSVRVDKLEDGHGERRKEMDALFAAVRRIEDVMLQERP